MPSEDFFSGDLEQLAERGIPVEEVRRQIDLFRRPPSFARLERPCAVGDGIVRLDTSEIAGLQELHAEAARSGRFLKFVPASGAASRMFRDLLHYQRGPGRGEAWDAIVRAAGKGDGRARAMVRFIEQLERFAFADDLRRTLWGRGSDPDRLVAAGAYPEILDALLDPAGLDYDARPKGLLKFHAYPGGSRTPFEEHLAEAAVYVRDAAGITRLHFTVSAEHQDAFETLMGQVGPEYGRLCATRFEVGFSTQHPSTDTLAVDLENRPLRDARGRLVFRPGGHGALIQNLADLDGDLVYIRNIDNIQPEHRWGVVTNWKRILGGYLVRLQREIHERLRRLREPEPRERLLDETARFAASRLQVELNGRLDPLSLPARRAWLIDQLDRPLRVCGVVPNRGEPGGGPFWVRSGDGSVRPQIVEGAQINKSDEAQQELLRSSTHFNSVDIVCAMRDLDGKPYDLRRFVDDDAVIVTEKSSDGLKLRALERPGLWNGAMAGWNTVFVEVPLESFAPVKSVLDLLREEHQPEES
jgi:hypothetical protein